MQSYKPHKLPPNFDFETKAILKKLSDAKSALAELRGFAKTIPNQEILINSLVLQEAKDSSEVESIITTHDELFKAELKQEIENISVKEVQNYSFALKNGYEKLKTNNIIKNECILTIQKNLERNEAGYRKLPGTALKNDKTGEVIYEPIQNGEEIKILMSDLVDYINNDERHKIDPLIKMAIIHHQFESIHPFYNGNGRTGRILNVLYLILKNLLDSPILYLSRFVIQNKSEYYRLLQNVRDNNDWENWILFILNGVELTALDTIKLIEEIRNLMQEYKVFLRDNFSFYSQDLLNNLFKHPYTKIDFLKNDLGVTRKTASKYLNDMANFNSGFLSKMQIGKSHYFVNVKLFDLLNHERRLVSKKVENLPN